MYKQSSRHLGGNRGRQFLVVTNINTWHGKLQFGSNTRLQLPVWLQQHSSPCAAWLCLAVYMSEKSKRSDRKHGINFRAAAAMSLG